ncbi:MAG: NAD(P)-dependent oxidoreductase [Leptospira sp.]|nr:NAD(P)-dependent oxidoreductase [Leptospira sp.]
MKKNPSILLTGGSGTIGIRLIENLIEDNKIIAVGRNLGNYPEAIREHRNFKFYECDLSNSQSLEIQDKVDAIVHLAAIVSGSNSSKEEYLNANLRSTELLLYFAIRNRIKKFIFSSSSSVYGKEAGILKENANLSGKSYYAQSKILAEKKIMTAKLNVIIFRLASVYGKSTKSYISKLAGFLKIGFVPSPEDSKTRKSFIYIDDAVEFFVNAIGSDKKIKGIYNIAHPDPVSYDELLKLLKLKLNRKIALKIPVGQTVQFFIKLLNRLLYILKIAQNDRLIDISALLEPIVISSEKAMHDFGFSPGTGIKDGIEKSFR